MRRETVLLIVAAAIVCGGVVRVRASVQANANGPARKPPGLSLFWGEPKDGLQIGLFPRNPQKEYHYGDTLELALRARNVSDKPLTLNVMRSQVSLVVLEAQGHLLLETSSVGGATAPLHIAPNETVDLAGGVYKARIVAPGTQSEPGSGGFQLALLPGDYHAEWPLPLFFPDPKDFNREGGNSAGSGLVFFTVRANAAQPPTPRPNALDANGVIGWGKAVNGLQGGVQRITAQELAVLPGEHPGEAAADEILTRFYVRNTSDRPLTIAFHAFTVNDASFEVQDMQGKLYSVFPTLSSGWPVLLQKTLKPGESIPTGWGRLKFHKPEHAIRLVSREPLLRAEPGQYRLRLINSVGFPGQKRFSMTLSSAELLFTVPSEAR